MADAIIGIIGFGVLICALALIIGIIKWSDGNTKVGKRLTLGAPMAFLVLGVIGAIVEGYMVDKGGWPNKEVMDCAQDAGFKMSERSRWEKAFGDDKAFKEAREASFCNPNEYAKCKQSDFDTLSACRDATQLDRDAVAARNNGPNPKATQAMASMRERMPRTVDMPDAEGAVTMKRVGYSDEHITLYAQADMSILSYYRDAEELPSEVKNILCTIAGELRAPLRYRYYNMDGEFEHGFSSRDIC